MRDRRRRKAVIESGTGVSEEVETKASKELGANSVI